MTRYDIARFRLGQALVPVALIATVLWRRFPDSVPLVAVVVAQGLAAIAFLSAVRWFGRQQLRVHGGAVCVGTTGPQIKRSGVREWTLVGSTARIYCGDESFRLRVRPDSDQELDALLRPLLGKPTELKRRGTERARRIALGVGVAGLVSVLTSFAIDGTLVLTIIGTPALIFGIVTFGALSQRVRS